MDVLALMRSKGIETFDYIFMHGSFPHQMPKSPSIHDPDRYLSICKHLVIAGHVHQHSVYRDRLTIPGSFDRDRHGDETPKGFLRFCGSDWTFVLNEGAKIYKTLDVRNMELTEAIALIKTYCNYPDGTYMRIYHSADLDIVAAMDTIRSLNKQYVWSSIKEVTKAAILEDLSKPFEDAAITIDSENIIGLIEARLALNKEDSKIFNELMRRVIDVTK